MKNTKLFSPIIELVAAPFIQTKKEKLQEVVQHALRGTNGTYSVVVKDLKTGLTTSVNEQHMYEAASLYKLWIMATTMQQEQRGKLTEDEMLSEEVSVLNQKFDISTESAELTEGELTLSINSALKQMIVISHNYAAFLLAEKIRLSNVTIFLKENGFSQSSVGQPPKTTATDMALYLEKLYKGELADREHTKEMLDLLKAQQLNNKLPKYLPEDAIIAHKTGEIGTFSHDVGIVYSGHADYLIVVLSDSDYPPDAEERIAQISKVVYQYFDEES